jgi:hypothetical protein
MFNEHYISQTAILKLDNNKQLGVVGKINVEVKFA